MLKELRNHIFRIICVFYFQFQETSFCLSVFNLFSVFISFELGIIFIELQHLNNDCLYN